MIAILITIQQMFIDELRKVLLNRLAFLFVFLILIGFGFFVVVFVLFF